LTHNEYEPLRREYSELASRYDSRWKFYGEASIRGTLRSLRVAPGERVLDVGCGTGALLEALSLTAPEAKFTGIDLSREMLGIARRRLGADVDLWQACAENLPFGDAAFDLLVSTNVFHFIRHPVSALREMRPALKPAGRLVITDWCHDYLACRICDIYLRVFSRGHFRTYRADGCRQLIVEAGFADPTVECYKINWLWGLMTATASSCSPSSRPSALLSAHGMTRL